MNRQQPTIASISTTNPLQVWEAERYIAFRNFYSQIYNGPLSADVAVDPGYATLSNHYSILRYLGEGKLGVRDMDLKFIEVATKRLFADVQNHPHARTAMIDWHYDVILNANPDTDSALYLTNVMIHTLPTIIAGDKALAQKAIEKGRDTYRALVTKDPALAADLMSHLFKLAPSNDHSSMLVGESLEALRVYSRHHPEKVDDFVTGSLFALEQKNMGAVIYKEFSILPCDTDGEKHAIVVDQQGDLMVVFNGKKYEAKELKQNIFQRMAQKFLAPESEVPGSEAVLKRLGNILPPLQEKMKTAPSLKECVVAPDCHEKAHGIPFRWHDFK